MSNKNNQNNSKNNRNDVFKRGEVGVKPPNPGTSKPDYTKPAPTRITRDK